MSIDLLERAADALGPLLDEVTFVGGATVGLWITDPAAPAPRPTKDVDVVIEVTTRAALHKFDERMRAQGFREDIGSGVICRWRHGREDPGKDLILDAMPTEASLLGFANRWQGAAVPHAAIRTLPSGARIRAITPAYLVATKLEAFRGRGRGDHFGSRDLEDVIAIVDGRQELAAEVHDAPVKLREYLTAEVSGLLDERRFIDAVSGFLRGDPPTQARANSVVIPRLRLLAERRTQSD